MVMYMIKAYNTYITKYIIFLFSISLLSFHASQGQNFNFSQAVKLSGNINSIAEESMPIISIEGNKMFFVRTFHEKNTGGKYSGQDIWMSVKNEFNEWLPATNKFDQLNNYRNNAVIGINRDESALLLTNAYNPINTTILGISRSIKMGSYWSKPNDVNIDGIDSKNSFIGFYMNSDENVLLISMDHKNTQGEEDIYICLKSDEGIWSAPDNLGSTINTSGFEISPFISNNGKLLFFASNGHGGFGDADIFMSRRLYDSWGIWSKPINLGEHINSEAFDAYFHLFSDKEAYFASNREGGLSDIYISKVASFENAKESALFSENKFKLTDTEIQELLGMPVSRNIYFEFGSSNIAASSIELIDFLASKLLTKRQYHIELIGHTDNEGGDDFNQKLSENRADEVSKYFKNYGIDKLRIFTTGVGESQPLFKEGTDEEIAKNRRVEIQFVK